jgi:phosphoglycolate phosphatase-like HAD superfamily hydrolase
MPVMLVSYGYSQGLDLAELGPDAVIDSLAQVAELIELTEE